MAVDVIEAAARAYCRAMGVDPDARVASVSDPGRCAWHEYVADALRVRAFRETMKTLAALEPIENEPV